MSITYKGDEDFEEIENPAIDLDDFGMDRLVRVYGGSPSKLVDFLKTLTKHLPDAEFPALTLRAKNASPLNASYYRVTTESVGLFAGEIPDPVISGGWREQTVQLFNEKDEQCEVTYRAPFTTWRYVSENQPFKRRFVDTYIFTEDLWEIVDIRGSRNGEIVILKSPRISNLTEEEKKSAFFCTKDSTTSAFTFDMEGRVWRVVEENQGTFIARARSEIDQIKRFVI